MPVGTHKLTHITCLSPSRGAAEATLAIRCTCDKEFSGPKKLALKWWERHISDVYGGAEVHRGGILDHVRHIAFAPGDSAKSDYRWRK